MRQPTALQLSLAGLMTLAVAIGIGRFAFTPILPMMQKDMGLTLRAAGFLASANYVGYFIGALSAIWLRLSPALAVRGSVLAIAVLTAAMGFLDNMFAWLLLRTLAGVASAWALVFASAWILPQLAAMNKGTLGGVVFGGVGFGTALTGALCVIFLQLSWTADQAWIAMGLTALLFSLGSWRVFGGAREAGPKPAQAQSAAALPAAETWRLVLCYGSFGFGYIIPATFIPAMARQVVADPAVFGWAWPIFGTAALLSALLAGWLSGRFTYRRIWAVAQVVMMAGVLVPVLWTGIGGILVSAICVGGTFMVATMAGMQEARRVAPARAASLMAAMTAAFALGQIFGPLLVSFTAGVEWGMNAALLTAAVLLAAGAVALQKKGES